MKNQKWLARVIAASLVFGMAGAVSSQANELVVYDGETKTIANQDVKGVWIKQASTLNATNVNFIDGGTGNNEVAVDDGSTLIMTGGSIKAPNDKFGVNESTAKLTNVTVTSGAYANESAVDFENCTISGNYLYAGHLWEGYQPKETGDSGSVTIKKGTLNVSNIWGYEGEFFINKASTETSVVKLENSSFLLTRGGSFTADTVTVLDSGINFKYNVKADVKEMTLDDSKMWVSNCWDEDDGQRGTPTVKIQKVTLKDRSFIELWRVTLQIGSLHLDGTVPENAIYGDGTVIVNDANLSKGTLTLGRQSDDNEESAIALAADDSDSSVSNTDTTTDGVKLVTKKLTMQDGTIAVTEGSSYELQGEDNVLSGNAKISVTDGSQVSLAKGAAIHAEADDNNQVKTVIEADADSTADVSKGTLYVSNAKKDGTAYDVSTAVKQGDEAKGNDFSEVYGESRRVKSTKNEAGEYVFASNISELAKDSAIPHVLEAVDSSTGDFANFLDKAFGDGMTDAEGLNAVEHVASMAGMLGVTHGTYSFAEDMSGLVADQAGAGRGIWATYVHQNQNVDGFSAIGRKAKYDMKYNGILLGGDFRTKEDSRTGMAFVYADGSHTEEDGIAAKADTKYYGLDVYHHFKAGDVSYKADIGYIKGDYDLEQTQLGTTIKGSLGGNAFFAGIRAEKDFACGASTLTPYAGLRYYRVHTGNFTDSFGVKHETDTANIWTLPLGVVFRHETKNGAWTVSPVAELGYRFILGGKDTNETVSFGEGIDRYSLDVAENSFLARLGIEADSRTWNLSGGYRYQKGSNSHANEWYLQIGYHF